MATTSGSLLLQPALVTASIIMVIIAQTVSGSNMPLGQVFPSMRHEKYPKQISSYHSREGSDRQIAPSVCKSEKTGEEGVCMFAWYCAKKGGLHLGTCIDRFYFGSCCKIPDEEFTAADLEDVRPVILSTQTTTTTASTTTTVVVTTTSKTTATSTTTTITTTSTTTATSTTTTITTTSTTTTTAAPTTTITSSSTSTSTTTGSTITTTESSTSPTTTIAATSTSSTAASSTVTSASASTSTASTELTTETASVTKPTLEASASSTENTTEVTADTASVSASQTTAASTTQTNTAKPNSTTKSTTDSATGSSTTVDSTSLPSTSLTPESTETTESSKTTDLAEVTTSLPKESSTKQVSSTEAESSTVIVTTTTEVLEESSTMLSESDTESEETFDTAEIIEVSTENFESAGDDVNLEEVNQGEVSETLTKIKPGTEVSEPSEQSQLEVVNNDEIELPKGEDNGAPSVTPESSIDLPKQPDETLESDTEAANDAVQTPDISDEEKTEAPAETSSETEDTNESTTDPIAETDVTPPVETSTNATLVEESTTFMSGEDDELATDLVTEIETSPTTTDSTTSITSSPISTTTTETTSTTETTATSTTKTTSTTETTATSTTETTTTFTTTTTTTASTTTTTTTSTTSTTTTTTTTSKPALFPTTSITLTNDEKKEEDDEDEDEDDNILNLFNIDNSTLFGMTLKPLHEMTYKEACGRRPWFSNPNRETVYPDGVKSGASEAPIGSGKKPRKERRLFSKYDRGNREGRIVSGASADYGEWPWQVSLRQWRTATYLHKCGCALLSENWAITAAHCVENVSPDDLSLRMGEYNLNGEEEPHSYVDRKVQIVASHPKFDPKTFEYDLALLRFYEPVKFSPNIIPICVPEDDEDLVGETAWVTGWGRLYEDGPLPSVMQEVDLPVIDNKDCEKMYKDAGYVEHIPKDIFICAGYAAGGKDSCEGDSGGPMVVQRRDHRFMLSGVISWGIGCAEQNQPGVYTRISHFRDWINQILQF